MNNKLKNKATIIALLTIAPSFLFAASKVKSNPIWTWMLNNIVFIIVGMIIMGVFFALWNLMNAIMISKAREYLKAKGIEPSTAPAQSSETFLSRWYNKAWNLVPIDKESDIQLDHNYDGIKELDNSLPPWWLYGFYLSIIVAAGYLYVHHFSDIGLSQHAEYEVAMQEGERQKAAFAARQVNSIDEKNLVSLTDEKSLATGAIAYKNKCAACHGPEGQGGVGPNLTDDYWIHGGSTVSIYKTIKNGVPEKGMIAWRTQMQPTTIHKVTSYIQTLKGTNPPNPKSPQGDLYEDESGAIGMVDDK